MRAGGPQTTLVPLGRRKNHQPVTTPYHPPVKRSLAIHGHKTSISLEPLFWAMLKKAAAREGVAMAQLVTRIDGERIRADPAPGLAGAIRVWLVTNAERNASGNGATEVEHIAS